MTQEIPLNQIEASPFNPRNSFPEDVMAELAASIKKHGVLQPVIARPVQGKKHKGVQYQLVAGERRWRACMALAEKDKRFVVIPATVRALSDIEAQEIALVENLQREDVSDYAIALGLKKKLDLHEKAGTPLSLRGLAAAVGKSAGWINHRLNLLKLKPELQEVAATHTGSVMSSLFAINEVDDSELVEELVEAVKSGASFSKVTALIEAHDRDEDIKKQSGKADAPTRKQTQSRGSRQREAEAEIKTKLVALRGNIAGIQSYWASAGAEFREEHAPTLKELARILAGVGK